MRDSPKTRAHFRHFHPITTRWADNDIHEGEAIGLVVETHCNYFSSVTFPEPVVAGLCVARLGESSVRYEVGIFRGDDDVASAQGHFVHVYVDRATRRPTQIPAAARALLHNLLVKE